MQKIILYLNSSISYHVEGNGKTLMLVHGFGETSEVWRQQIDHLKETFTVIAPDLPGSGGSDLIEEITMESMAACLKAILEIEQSNLPVLIGHSMGGYVVLAFAEMYPDTLGAMGLFESTAIADTDEKKATRRKGIEFINNNGAFEFLKSTTPKLFSSETRKHKPGMPETFIQSLNNFSGESLVYYYEAMIGRPDRQNILSKSKIPILIVLGKQDTAIDFEEGLKLCSLPGIAYIHVLYHSGHMGMLEEPAKTNDILETFLIDSSTANP